MSNVEKVNLHMKVRYGKSLDDMEISHVPGYWRDKEPQMHKGHPLHTCLGCGEPFKATYTYFDPARSVDGRFASRTRTWRSIAESEGV